MKPASGDIRMNGNAGVISGTGTDSDDFTLKSGARCRPSELGRLRSPKLAAAAGTILRRPRIRNQVVVLWDGNVTPITLHRTYVEPLEQRDLCLGAPKSAASRDKAKAE